MLEPMNVYILNVLLIGINFECTRFLIITNEFSHSLQKSGPPKSESEIELEGCVLDVGSKDKKEKAKKNVLSVSKNYFKLDSYVLL